MSEQNLTRRAVVAALLMAAAAAGGEAMVPTRRMSQLRGAFDLATLVPSTFASWQVDDHGSAGIVNPQTAAMLNRLYSQLLDRVYVDDSGRRIMLSIAYGSDQADDSVQLHYPEVCYPAQGFQVTGNRRESINLSQGVIHVRRLETRFSDSRFEPVTYWTIVGDQQVIGGWERKKAEISHGLRGEIVDGLLFRVSSIDRDSAAAFRDQDVFIGALIQAMSPAARHQLAAL